MKFEFEDLDGKNRHVEFPDGATNLKLEFGGGGVKSNRKGVWLWYRHKDIIDCRLVSMTRRQEDLHYYQSQFDAWRSGVPKPEKIKRKRNAIRQ